MDKDEYHKFIRMEREQTATEIRNIAMRIGSGAWGPYVKEELEKLASRLELWAKQEVQR